jgi:5-methylthioadenosine/S-adenosylhomocysteine deaminase
MAFALQRMFAHAAREQGRSRPALLSARDVVGIATRGGAEVLGLAGSVCRLAPGLRADLIALDAGMINVAPLNDPYGVVVTAMETSNVRHVWVDGLTRKWHGRLVGVDVAALLAAAERSRTRLLAVA